MTGRTGIRWPLRLLAALTGYGISALVLYWSLTNRGFIAPDILIWDRVGDQVLAGISPYSIAYPWQGLFFYAPPWALVFGLTSWLPVSAQAALVFLVSLGALRYVAGSWLRVGYLGLCPITGGELANGSFNLVLAAAVAMAVRGDGRLAALTALAKFSPILAIRDVRRSAVVLIAVVVLTLPLLGWWMDWIALLIHAQSHYSIGYPISWPLRLTVALGLLVVSRDAWWAQALAPAIAIPALYSYSIVLLYALIPDASANPGVVRRIAARACCFH